MNLWRIWRAEILQNACHMKIIHKNMIAYKRDKFKSYKRINLTLTELMLPFTVTRTWEIMDIYVFSYLNIHT